MDNITLTDDHLRQARAVVAELGLDIPDAEIIALLREVAIWNPPSIIDQFRAEIEQQYIHPTTN